MQGNVSNVAFKNPDGSISLVVVNRSNAANTNYDPNTSAQVIQIMTPDGMFQDTIPGDTVATYRWHPTWENSVSKVNWTASANAVNEGYTAYQAVDGIAETLWLTGSNQSSGQEFVVDLGRTTSINQITLNVYGSFSNDYPGSYTVFASNDQITWTQVCDGIGTSGVTNIVLPQQITAQYIKISLFQTDLENMTL